MSISKDNDLIILLNDLIDTWPDFYAKPDYYISTYLPSLLANNQRGTMREDFLISNIRDKLLGEDQEKIIVLLRKIQEKNMVDKLLCKAEKYLKDHQFSVADSLFNHMNSFPSAYQSLRAKYYQEFVNNVIEKITLKLFHYDFEAATSLYLTIQDSYPQQKFDQMVSTYKIRKENEEKERVLNLELQNIRDLLEKYDFIQANNRYATIKEDYPEEKYHQLYFEYEQRQAREIFQSSIQQILDEEDFLAADRHFSASKLIDYGEYLQIKSPYIQNFVENHYRKSINIEKAEALASTSPNLLLSARAGSGKTTVLACKTGMLIDCYQINPDEILVMAFNKKAADEIRHRIRVDYKQPGFDNARTFHSLAHQLVRPNKGQILYDENDDVPSRKMTLLVQQLLKEQIENPIFIEKLYALFRKEIAEIERAGFLLDDETYFDFRRNLLQFTLNGEKVKSIGEKIIADFLFEHDISYRFDEVWLWRKQIIRSDFSIYQPQNSYVIEIWPINEDDPKKQVSPEASQTWDEYYSEMQTKRQCWNSKSVTLIEISKEDSLNQREVLESILENKLIKAGIYKPKLTTDNLIKKIKDKDYIITRLSEAFTQFIQRAKKKMLKPNDVQNLRRSYQPIDGREAIFLDIACRIYEKYEQELSRQQKIDFDDLMMLAIQKIHETQGNCEILLGNPKNRSIRMNDLRWILIDEYQDFSELFYKLITAIQKYNPQVRLFCVGDDWQAINGFAGSDLQFFKKFTEWVKDSQIAYLVTNFRSQAAIVQNGNALMKGLGKPGESLPENNQGKVNIEYVNDVWVEMRNNDIATIQKKEDERFLISEVSTNGKGKKPNKIIESKYLKKCYQIITSSENQGKSVAILSRTNWIEGMRLNDFKNRLIACFTPEEIKNLGDLKKMIDVQTVHKYKGLEADLVIMMGACNGAFPLLHPDNALFGIFRVTLKDVFEEEQRLFYVAITRAKSSLYILTERGRESVFLKKLPGFMPNQSNSIPMTRLSQFASPFFEFDEENIPF